jgi:hypothetical protein
MLFGLGHGAPDDKQMARRHQRQNGTCHDVEQITRHLARPAESNLKQR